MPDDFEQHYSVDAPMGVDELGRVVFRGEITFTCPDCGSSYDVEVTLPLAATNG
jgi:hypothetical protein